MIGVATQGGVVIVAEKRVSSSLVEPSSIEKIVEIDSHVGAAMSGLTADARTMIEHARVECQNHRFNFDEPLEIEALTQSICDLALQFGEDGDNEDTMSRPFGVSLLIAGYHPKTGPCLYMTDPSGTYFKYQAKAIGAASESAQAVLQENMHRSMTLAEAEALAVSTLKQSMEERLNATNIEVAAVSAESKVFRVYAKDEVEALIQRVNK